MKTAFPLAASLAIILTAAAVAQQPESSRQRTQNPNPTTQPNATEAPPQTPSPQAPSHEQEQQHREAAATAPEAEHAGGGAGANYHWDMKEVAPVQTHHSIIRNAALFCRFIHRIASARPEVGYGPIRVLIVSPTYQEAENIEEFLRRVRAGAPDADILIVDDSSPDGTAEIADGSPTSWAASRSSAARARTASARPTAPASGSA